ncbi:DinB family protein [bacterium]|nr:DinB family protein [bacterium]
MKWSEPLVAELQYESVATRRMLERVPQEMMVWKPHSKSRSLGEIAAHIAHLPGLFIASMRQNELDKNGYPTPAFNRVSDVTALFDKNIRDALAVLRIMTDEQIVTPWRYRYGEKIIFEMPRLAVIRGMGISHLIHHRGQLSVYLRLLDVPLPPVYGQTADEG